METEITPKTCVVTGATSGIGLAAAEMLARSGIAVIGTGRSPERCREIERRLQMLHPAGQAACLTADLSSQKQIHGLAQSVRDTLDLWNRTSLDALLNNAGTFTYWLTLTPEGFETQWAVNHLAPFLLTNLLLPLLLAAPAPRVVTVSSASHYNTRLRWDDIQMRHSYNGLLAYNQSKLANVLFTAELNRRFGSAGLRAFAADPGLVRTEIGYKGTPSFVRWIWGLRSGGGIPPEQSARGIVYLVTEASIQVSTEVYWKHGQPKAASREALNLESASRLWALSEQMCALAVEN